MDSLNTNGPVSTKPGQLQSDAQGVIQQIIAGAPAGARIVVVGVCMDTDRFEPFFGIVKQINRKRCSTALLQ